MKWFTKAWVAAALALAVVGGGVARAEIVYVEPMVVLVDEDGKGLPACDAQALLVTDLDAAGLTVITELGQTAPELVVSTQYEEVGGVGWLTLRTFDAVVGRMLLADKLYLSNDSWQCRQIVGSIANKITRPPFYDQKRRFLVDAITGMEFILVPGGAFKAGPPESERVYQVEGFFMARFEVTQRQWEKVMGENPSGFRGNPERPVESISWYDVVSFIEALNKKSRTHYRLPTELEWEYAARSRGRAGRWSGTDNTRRLTDFAWTREDAGGMTHPVGRKKANGLGIYDMSGNVWEWCQTAGDEGPFAVRGDPEAARNKVIRGGSWMTGADYAVVTRRELARPESRSNDNGFRLVVSVKTPAAEGH